MADQPIRPTGFFGAVMMEPTNMDQKEPRIGVEVPAFNRMLFFAQCFAAAVRAVAAITWGTVELNRRGDAFKEAYDAKRIECSAMEFVESCRLPWTFPW